MPGTVSIAPLLSKLANPTTTYSAIDPAEISAAISLVFTNSVSPVQAGCLLFALHTTQLERHADVLAACAMAMRGAARAVDAEAISAAVKARGLGEGDYHGGLVDMVGTGGDSHNTYNVSTTASIIASSLLLVAKHGNNASTSRSGSADLLLSCSPAPVISSASAPYIPRIYAATNYAFLYARDWHTGMLHAAAIRKELPFRSIFNLLGPLANPLHDSGLIEARVLGVAKQDMGRVFAESLRLGGATKALVVCGAEDLDEISCAGSTSCWLLRRRQQQQQAQGTSTRPGEGEVEILPFSVHPRDFGLAPVPLSAVAGGKSPGENAAILKRLLAGELPDDDPVLTFVLLNAAALFVVSGVCEADGHSAMGPGDDGVVIRERGPGEQRWKEGVRRARWAISSGAARRQWEAYVEVTREIAAERSTAEES